MKTFMVNSHIAPGQLDSMAWVQGIAKMLRDAKIDNVKLNTAYSSPDKKMIGEFHANDKQTLTNALNKIEFPFSEITEVTENI